jgi:hypothetical protein
MPENTGLVTLSEDGLGEAGLPDVLLRSDARSGSPTVVSARAAVAFSLRMEVASGKATRATLRTSWLAARRVNRTLEV